MQDTLLLVKNQTVANDSFAHFNATAAAKRVDLEACVRPDFLERDDAASLMLRTIPWQADNASAVFSTQTVVSPVVSEFRAANRRESESQAWMGGALSLVVVVLYCYLIFRYRVSVVLTLKAMLYKDSKEKIEADLDFNFKRQFGYAQIICLCVFTLTFYKSLMLFVDLQSLGYPQWMLFAAVFLGVALLGGYQMVVIWMAAIVSRDDYFFARLRLNNRLALSNCALILTPPLLFYANSATPLPTFVVAAAAVVATALLIKHITQTYLFFKEEKVSSFQWFLYLCTAELVPWSFFFVLASRNTF